MNLVSLLILPAIINWEAFREEDGNSLRFVVAGVAFLVLAGAVIWSSRKTAGIATPTHLQIDAPISGA
jgi:hypothetical protein